MHRVDTEKRIKNVAIIGMGALIWVEIFMKKRMKKTTAFGLVLLLCAGSVQALQPYIACAGEMTDLSEEVYDYSENIMTGNAEFRGLLEPVEWNGHVYQVLQTWVGNWEAMEAFCENQGGYLACITSREEDEFLYDLTGYIEADKFYFGLYCDTFGNWSWVSGEPVEYTNWNSAEPNGFETGEQYGDYRPEEYPAGSWNHEGYDGGGLFFCEWNSWDERHSGEELYYLDTAVFQDHFYQLLYVPVSTWPEKEELCRQLGGYMACIETEEENRFLYEQFIIRNHGEISIGLNYEDGEWRWVNGAPLTYMNWAEGQPDLTGGYELFGSYQPDYFEDDWNDNDGLPGYLIMEQDEIPGWWEEETDPSVWTEPATIIFDESATEAAREWPTILFEEPDKTQEPETTIAEDGLKAEQSEIIMNVIWEYVEQTDLSCEDPAFHPADSGQYYKTADTELEIYGITRHYIRIQDDVLTTYEETDRRKERTDYVCRWEEPDILVYQDYVYSPADDHHGYVTDHVVKLQTDENYLCVEIQGVYNQDTGQDYTGDRITTVYRRTEEENLPVDVLSEGEWITPADDPGSKVSGVWRKVEGENDSDEMEMYLVFDTEEVYAITKTPVMTGTRVLEYSMDHNTLIIDGYTFATLSETEDGSAVLEVDEPGEAIRFVKVLSDGE